MLCLIQPSLLRRLRRRGKSTRPADGRADAAVSEPTTVGASHWRESGQQPAPVPESPGETASTGTTLELLPAELRRRVLLAVADVGIEHVKALVHASPVFHAQYLLGRKTFLCRGLEAALGSVLVDALALRMAARLHGTFGVYQAAELNYASLRSATPSRLAIDLAWAHDDDIATMVRFYVNTVCPLLDWCAALFLRTLDFPFHAGSLSATERTRLLRGLYRFQLCCSLSSSENHRIRARFGELEESSVAMVFSAFQPWEVEEIDCLYSLIRQEYEAVIDALYPKDRDVSGTQQKLKRWIQRSPGRIPRGPGLGNIDRRAFTQGPAAGGLRLFLEVLETRDRKGLAKTMEEKIEPQFRFIDSGLCWKNLRLAIRRNPSEQDRAQSRRKPVPFLGDGDGGPPLAWVILWRGRYPKEYGRHVDGGLKLWGYVFWDHGRLTDSGGKAIVMQKRQGERLRPSS